MAHPHGLPGPTDLPLDPDGRLSTDTPCQGCGYNLKSVPMAGNCPECGVDLWDSLEGYRLKYEDPAWVRGLYQGTIRFCVAMVLIIGWHITAIVRDDLDVCLDYMWSLRPDPEFGWSIVIMGFAYVISPPISMLLLTLGAFQCTRPRPGSLTTREARLKHLASGGAAFGFVLFGVVLSLGVWISSFFWAPMILFLVYGTVLIWPLIMLGIMTHWRQIALEIPDRSITKTLNMSLYALVPLLTFCLFLPLVSLLFIIVIVCCWLAVPAMLVSALHTTMAQQAQR